MENKKDIFQGLKTYKAENPNIVAQYLCDTLMTYEEPLDYLHDQIWEWDWHIRCPEVKEISVMFDKHRNEIVQIVKNCAVDLTISFTSNDILACNSKEITLKEFLADGYGIDNYIFQCAIKSVGEDLNDFLQEGYC